MRCQFGHRRECLRARGIRRCGDLQDLPISVLGKRYGNPGRRIWLMAQGLDPAPVTANIPPPRSLGHSKVLPPDTRDADTVRTFLLHMAHKLGARLRANGLVCGRFLFGFRLYRGWLKTSLRPVLPSDDEMVIYRLGNNWFEREWQGQGIWQVHVIALEPAPARQPDLFQRKHPRSRATPPGDGPRQRTIWRDDSGLGATAGPIQGARRDLPGLETGRTSQKPVTIAYFTEESNDFS